MLSRVKRSQWLNQPRLIAFLAHSCHPLGSVTAQIDGEPVRCLLDSGCERNVIARSLVPNLELAHSRYTLSAANKMDLPILGDTDLQFTVDRHRFLANVSISPAIDKFILGSDWLVKNEAKWDFAPGTISFGNRVIHAYQQTFNELCLRIVVSEDCVVPAKHEANILVKVMDDGIPYPWSDWAIRPCQLEPRVIAARTLATAMTSRWCVSAITQTSLMF